MDGGMGEWLDGVMSKGICGGLNAGRDGRRDG